MHAREAAAVELAAMRRAWRDLAARWDLTFQERRALLPEGGDGLRSPPEDTEARMRILVEVGHRLRLDDDAGLREWLRLPAELWGWRSPLEVMSGAPSELRRFREYVERGFGW